MSQQSDDVLSFVRSLMVKNYPKPWQRLWENIHALSQKERINVNASLEVFKLTYECISKEEEGRPVSTGFLVGEPDVFKQRLPDKTGIELERKNITEQLDKIRRLFGLIDGCSSIFIIGKDGVVEGSRLFPWNSDTSEETDFDFSTCDFSTHCNTLKNASGYSLLALGYSKTAKLFANGTLNAEVYFSGKTGTWTYRSLQELLEKLDQIALKKNLDRKLLHKILSVAINMSNHRKGGTMIIGNHEAIFQQSEPPRLMLTGLKLLDMKGLQEKHLYNLASQEFALIIGRDGEIKGSSVRLLAKVPDGVTVEVTASDGGRHRSAAEITATTDAISFVVSDDGPITVFEEGKRVIRV